VLIERDISPPFADQSNTEGAPGSSFEPGSWGCLLVSLFHVDRHEPRGSSPVKSPTAPRPIFRMSYQSANHRICVNVVQLFPLLPFAVNVEIVKPRLPKRPQWFSRLRKRQSHLPRAHRPSPLPQFPRHTQLQLLQHRRGRPLLRLTHQEMHMLRHHHIAEQMKPHLVAHLPQLFHKHVPRAHRLQERQPPIATKRNKMQIAFAVVAPQSCRHRTCHGKNVNPRRRFKNRTWGTLLLSILPQEVPQ
jgi:hypothetical protein